MHVNMQLKYRNASKYAANVLPGGGLRRASGRDLGQMGSKHHQKGYSGALFEGGIRNQEIGSAGRVNYMERGA